MSIYGQQLSLTLYGSVLNCAQRAEKKIQNLFAQFETVRLFVSMSTVFLLFIKLNVNMFELYYAFLSSSPPPFFCNWSLHIRRIGILMYGYQLLHVFLF
jgi:hypothetical protein